MLASFRSTLPNQIARWQCRSLTTMRYVLFADRDRVDADGLGFRHAGAIPLFGHMLRAFHLITATN